MKRLVFPSLRRSVTRKREPVIPGQRVGSAAERRLQEAYGTRERAERFYGNQVLDHLNQPMREFVAQQTVLFVATSDAGGRCDNTLRCGPAGFVQVLSEHRLTWPEYRGNGVLASLANISENPHVGLLFVDFLREGIGLHVNGAAVIVEDAALRAEHPQLPVDPAPGRRAERWVVTTVHEAYIHCAKHIPRYRERTREEEATDRGPRRGTFFAVEPAEAPCRAD